MNRSLALISLLVIATAQGCFGHKEQSDLGTVRLLLGVENPPLLPIEEKRAVTFHEQTFPAELSTNDLSKISTLVGRIPRLVSYDILQISKSTIRQVDYDVWVRSFMIRMARSPDWRVVRIEPVAY